MPISSERLKEIMKQRGITQAQLSRKTAIPKSAISQYLSKRFSPRDDRLEKIAEILGTSPAWLLGYTDNPDRNPPLILSTREECIILGYRSNPEIKEAIDNAIDTPRLEIFRAAKSQDGTVAPANEKITDEQLRRLNEAPETDEEL